MLLDFRVKAAVGCCFELFTTGEISGRRDGANLKKLKIKLKKCYSHFM